MCLCTTSVFFFFFLPLSLSFLCELHSFALAAEAHVEVREAVGILQTRRLASSWMVCARKGRFVALTICATVLAVMPSVPGEGGACATCLPAHLRQSV